MKLLLDTHTYLWLVDQPERLSRPARRLVEDGRTALSLSMASVWELAIKLSLGKLRLSGALAQHIDSAMADSAVSLLAIKRDHATAVAGLPHHHRDPFDRLLIAQAIHEDMAIVTADEIFDEYRVRRIW